MPNWCENRLLVRGPKSHVQAFLEAAQMTTLEGKRITFSFQALYPTPQVLLDTMSGFYGGGTPEQEAKQKALEAQEKANLALHGAKNWYDWRVARWSTKWDIDLEAPWSLSEDGDRIEAVQTFDTAWAPPERFLRKIAPDFPELTFRLEFGEPGCDFGGVLELAGEEETECWVENYAASPIAVNYDEDEDQGITEAKQEVDA